jgi:hypothetical protein
MSIKDYIKDGDIFTFANVKENNYAIRCTKDNNYFKNRTKVTFISKDRELLYVLPNEVCSSNQYGNIHYIKLNDKAKWKNLTFDAILNNLSIFSEYFNAINGPVSLVKIANEENRLDSLIQAAETEDLLESLLPVTKKGYLQDIIYGPAGVGKTYSIKKIALYELAITQYESQTIHTVFHPESSYYDFFGKVMPVKDQTNISYEFLPGPFAQALEKAFQNIIENQDNPQKVLIVIDELNRGNAATIFGGLFNLLDRNKNGVSEYPLNIYGMEAQWIYNKITATNIDTLCDYMKGKNDQLPSFEMCTGNNSESIKIFIPHNLSIVCTMNTSDQTIFSLDKAFQRRFDKRFVTADDSIDNYVNGDILIEQHNITWKSFLKNLNKFIRDNSDIDDIDNATIGAYFIKAKPKDDSSGDKEIKIEDIKYSIMYYLWYDLFNSWKRDDQLLKKLGDNFIEIKTFQEFVSNTKYQEFIEKINEL